MLRHNDIGTHERLSVERWEQYKRENIEPAVVARHERWNAGSINKISIAALDRHEYLWCKTAHTAGPGTEIWPMDAVNGGLSALQADFFHIPSSGVLRRVYCRDWDPGLGGPTAPRIMVLFVNQDGTLNTLALAPTLPPFDVTNLNVFTVNPRYCQVVAVDAIGNPLLMNLVVNLEFALTPVNA